MIRRVLLLVCCSAVVSCGALPSFVATPDAGPSEARFVLAIEFTEAALGMPPWRLPEANSLEAVRVDLVQDGQVRATRFADLRSRRRMSWEASPDTMPPYTFDIDLQASGLRPGPASVVASRWGFVAQQATIDLQPGSRADVDLELKRDPLFDAIVSPRLGSARTLIPGDTLLVEVSAPAAVTGWTGSLHTEHFDRPLLLVDAEYGRWTIRHGAEPGWRLRFAVPANTPEELYSLRLSSSLGVTQQPGAVHVLLEIPDPLYVAGNFHHALDSWRISVDGEIAALFRQTVNVIRPVFYANVDDISYEDERVLARIADAASRHLQVPYFHGLGNHDRGGIVDSGHYPHEPYPDQPMSVQFFRYYFGQRYQSRDIGPLHVIQPYCPDQWESHLVRPDQDRWLKQDLLDHQDAGLRLITCHHLTWSHPVDGEPWVASDLLDAQYGLNLALLERAHRTDDRLHRGEVPTWYGGLAKSPELELVGVLEISRLAAGDPRRDGGLIEAQPAIGRVQVDTALVESNYSTAVDKEARLPTCDTYVAGDYLIRDCTLRRFGVAWSSPDSPAAGDDLNGGTQSTLTATVSRHPDDNPITIRGGRLRFHMASGTYRAEGGRVVQQVDTRDGDGTLVYVAADIVHPETQITVRPAQ